MLRPGDRSLPTICILLAIALAARVGYLVVFQPSVQDWPDSSHNERIGWRLANGEPYDKPGELPPAIYRPPLLPAVIAGVYTLCGRSPLAGQVCLAMLGALGVIMLYLSALRVIGGKWAIAVGLAASLYPYHVFICGAFYPEALGVPLICLWAWLFIVCAQQERLRACSMILFGGVVGLGSLCRPNWLVTLPVSLLLLYLCRRLNRQNSPVRLFVAASLVWVAVWLPWSIRNLKSYGTPILITASGGKNFYLGNNPSAGWDTKTAVLIPDSVIAREIELRNTPPALERYFYSLAWGFIREDPVHYLALWAAKMVHLWQPVDSIRNHPVARSRILMVAVPYACVLMLAAAGAYGAVRERRYEILAILCVALIDGAFISMFIAPHRLRVPFDAVLVLAAGLGLCRLFSRRHATPAAAKRARSGS